MTSKDPIYRSKTEKLYWKYGIPEESWGMKSLSDFEFVEYRYAGFTFPPSAQRQMLRTIWETPRKQIVCIAQKKSSSQGETEDYARSIEPAISVGMFALRKIVSEHRRPVQIIQAGFKNDAEKKPRAVLIHNVLGDATSERIEKVRDELFRFSYCPRLVVVSACDTPEDFCRNRLGIFPTSCCLIG